MSDKNEQHKTDDGLAAKVRRLEADVADIKDKMTRVYGNVDGPTATEILAAKNAAKEKRIAAEQVAQEAADKATAKADLKADKAAARKILASVAILLALCFNTQAGNLVKWSDSTYVTDADTLATSNLTLSGTATVAGGVSYASVSNALTSALRSGTCTNGQTVTISPVMSAAPGVVATWAGGVLVTNAEGNVGAIYLSSSTPSNFVLQSTVAQTNTMRYLLINLP